MIGARTAIIELNLYFVSGNTVFLSNCPQMISSPILSFFQWEWYLLQFLKEYFHLQPKPVTMIGTTSLFATQFTCGGGFSETTIFASNMNFSRCNRKRRMQGGGNNENQLDFLWILESVAIEIFFLIEFNSNLWYFASTGICGENTTQRSLQNSEFRLKARDDSKQTFLQGCEG